LPVKGKTQGIFENFNLGVEYSPYNCFMLVQRFESGIVSNSMLAQTTAGGTNEPIEEGIMAGAVELLKLQEVTMVQNTDGSNGPRMTADEKAAAAKKAADDPEQPVPESKKKKREEAS
jgi:hypothetical protein